MTIIKNSSRITEMLIVILVAGFKNRSKNRRRPMGSTWVIPKGIGDDEGGSTPPIAGPLRPSGDVSHLQGIGDGFRGVGILINHMAGCI